MSHALSGKVFLSILVVTATTGGFTLGYFVGKSVSSPSTTSSVKQQLNEGEGTPPAPVPGANPAGEGLSAPLSVVQSPLPENKQPDITPSPLQKSPSRAETPDKRRAGISARQTPSVSDVKASAGEKRLPARTAVSRTAGPEDQAAARSSPAEGSTAMSGSGGSSADNVVYTVQAGAFKNREDAETLKRKLEAKKYKTSVTKEANAGGVVFFKVRTGEFENKKEAAAFALELKNTDGLNAFSLVKK